MQIVAINQAKLELFQHLMSDVAAYPLFQDTTEVNAWAQQGGGKDDFFVYDRQGRLQVWLPSNGTVDTDLSVPANLQNLRQMLLQAATVD